MLFADNEFLAVPAAAAMRKFGLGTIVALAFVASQAVAADLPVKAPIRAPAVYSWTGFYLGGHVGYGWSDATTKYTGDADVLTLVNAGALPVGYDVGRGGFAGGVQTGYNWQLNSLVLGIEADASRLSIGRNVSAQNINPAAIALPIRGGGFLALNQWDSTADLKADWVATVRGRAGLAFDRWMVFGTAGVAWADVATSGTLLRSFPVGGAVIASWAGSTSQSKTGYVVGGGVEYAMTNNWLVRIEGLYYGFGHVNDVVQPAPGNILADAVPLNRTTDVNLAVVRLGLNYKF